MPVNTVYTLKVRSLLFFVFMMIVSISIPSYAMDVSLSWNNSYEATGYKVYYETLSSAPGSPYTGTGAIEGNSPVDVKNNNQCVLSGLPYASYRFAVTAYNAYGESDYSDEVVLSPDIKTAALPFSEGFESGTLASCWKVNSTGAGRIRVSPSDDLISGKYHLTMDSSQAATYSLNELILTIDLNGRSGVILQFQHKEYRDENHVMPASFNGSSNSDGVAISANGTTWYKIKGLTSTDGITSGGTTFSVNLDAAVAAARIAYNQSFKIKFQQYDNYSIANDGFAFDNIYID